MKKRFALPIVSLVIIVGTALLILHPKFLVSPHSENEETPEIYFGVTFCGNTPAEANLLIDRVKDFTNLFVLYSGPVSKNETAMNRNLQICHCQWAEHYSILW